MAGSLKGERRGGRQKGTPNKKTQELLDKIIGTGMTPLEFLIETMRGKAPKGLKDEDGKAYKITFQERFEAARAAAPYVHAKRTQIEGTGDDGAVMVQIIGVDANL